MTSEYAIRPFRTIEEYRECVELQEATWGRGFSERVAPAILKVSQILGGVAAGAYDARDDLAGFVFGMTGVRGGELVHWSDMLAVRPEERDRGLGRTLKAYQRNEVLARGVRKMFWTFDPLQARNAYLNLAKLGVVVREYEVDMYGQTDSPLHRGIGTDRFIALWLLDSDRVERRLAEWMEGGGTSLSELPSGAHVALDAADGERNPKPAGPHIDLGTDLVAVAIPSDIASLMEGDPDLARSWREATRHVFTHYLASGYQVTELVRGQPVSTYVVERILDGEAA